MSRTGQTIDPMPEIQAFRGIRYDLGHVGSLADVTAVAFNAQQIHGATPAPHAAESTQAVMVRRLTAAVKKAELSPIPSINGTQEATSPYHKNEGTGKS